MANLKPAWSDGARTGPVRNYLQQRIFACEGMIVIIDHRQDGTGSFGDCVVLDCDTAESRARELSKDYRGQTRVDQPKRMQELWSARKQGCQNLLDCVKEARQMGDPNDPTVVAFWRKHGWLKNRSAAKPPTRRSQLDVLAKIPAPANVGTTILGTGKSDNEFNYTPPQRRQ